MRLLVENKNLSNLAKNKRVNLTKANFFRTDFLISKANMFLPIYEKFLSKYQFFIILSKNIIQIFQVLLFGRIQNQLISNLYFSVYLNYKISNSSISGKIGKIILSDLFLKKNDSYQDMTQCYYLQGYNCKVFILINIATFVELFMKSVRSKKLD